MTNNITQADLIQLEELGITPDQLQTQLENFKRGFPFSQLEAPATIENGGIIRLDDAQISQYLSNYARAAQGKRILKFVPASGAATRMFKELYAFSSTYTGVSTNFGKQFPEVSTFLENLHKFAFYDDLKQAIAATDMSIDDYMKRGDYTSIINVLLKEQYLSYGSLPKALLKFHRYGNMQRTPLEEHIVEGAEYARNSDGTVSIHFTVSPEHRQLFRQKVAEVKKHYEETLNIKLEISYSEQHHYTDTIAVDEYNNPIRDDAGRIVMRPGGHGALIENLNDCKADLIFIKNIDNVVPDWMKHTTVVYKKALAGMLLHLQAEIFAHLELLHSGDATRNQLTEIAMYAQEKLHVELPSTYTEMGNKELTDLLFDKLNRPIRICGMVKNQGEPGGGPFFTRNNHGIKSLQIVETAQINRKNEEQETLLTHSTHFNPVDLVCGTKDFRGRRFDLRQYVDHATGFISKKSKGATIVKSQELPGLWNGAMAGWITLFVEVPIATFNPVKTVNDLLRKEHLEQ